MKRKDQITPSHFLLYCPSQLLHMKIYLLTSSKSSASSSCNCRTAIDWGRDKSITICWQLEGEFTNLTIQPSAAVCIHFFHSKIVKLPLHGKRVLPELDGVVTSPHFFLLPQLLDDLVSARLVTSIHIVTLSLLSLFIRARFTIVIIDLQHRSVVTWNREAAPKKGDCMWDMRQLLPFYL